MLLVFQGRAQRKAILELILLNERVSAFLPASALDDGVRKGLR